MGRGFIWTPQKRQAVDLSVQGGISQREIAATLGTTRRTVEGWLRRKAVRAELDARRKAAREAFDAQFRAKYLPNAHELARDRAERAAREEANTQVWIAWKMACYRARAAHRKQPPMPPELA